MPAFSVPDKIAPETGWRVWLVVAHGPDALALHSAVQAKVEWPARHELRAECRRLAAAEGSAHALAGEALAHDAPDELCGLGGGHGCGIYAAKTLEACADYLKGFYSPTQVRGASVVHRVVGKVALWGKVIEAEHGWRAELAYPREIWIPPSLHVASGLEIGTTRPPALPAEEIALLLSRYGVPVLLLEDDEALLAA